MQIEVRFLCPELVGKMKNGVYSVPDGSTIRDLFAACMRENDFVPEQDYIKWLVLLADGRPAVWDTVLDQVSKVHVLRAVLGG